MPMPSPAADEDSGDSLSPSARSPASRHSSQSRMANAGGNSDSLSVDTINSNSRAAIELLTSIFGGSESGPEPLKEDKDQIRRRLSGDVESESSSDSDSSSSDSRSSDYDSSDSNSSSRKKRRKSSSKKGKKMKKRKKKSKETRKKRSKKDKRKSRKNDKKKKKKKTKDR